MRRKLRSIVALLVLPWLLVSVLGPRYATAASALHSQGGPQTFTAYMGAEIFTQEGEKSTWMAYRFYPESLTINVGDSVLWKHDAGIDPHTVTFLGASNEAPSFVLPPPEGGPAPEGPPKLEVNPLVVFPAGGDTYDGSTYTNSGIIAADIPGPREYKLTFTKPGTYKYICNVHTEIYADGRLTPMTAEVVVQAGGSAYPMTPAQVEAKAKADIEADKAKAMQTEAEAEKVAVASRPGPNGTSIHRVNVGYTPPTGVDGQLDYLRFAPKGITINQGDTVEWAIPLDRGFHNVTVGAEPEIFLFEPQGEGPPKVYINNLAFIPTGETTHTGTGTYSSGVMVGTASPPELGPPSYSLIFSQPGRYEYVCAFHYHNGMDGFVTVRDRTGAVPTAGMPRTGDTANWWLPTVVFLGLIFSMTGFVLRRHLAAKSA